MDPILLEEARVRARAVELYASANVDIEDEAAVVPGGDAHWVAAWVRVPRDLSTELGGSPARVVFVYSLDSYFCEACVPETIDLAGDDVHVYEEGISDAGFTGYPKCAACAREHRWVGLVVRCALCGADADADEAHRHGAGFIGACCWDERFRASE
jgi:hypothetical protein